MAAQSNAVNSPTRELAKFASGLKYSYLPKGVIDHTKLLILDTVGCGLFGSTLPWGRIIADYVREMGGIEKATVWGNSFKTSAANAALANGTMVHGFELDDFSKGAGVHAGGLTTSATLGTAEEKGGVSGKELLTAIVAGYEVVLRIGTCLDPGHILKGFHPTGTVGAFASAASAGKILNLSEEEMVHSLGIGGTQGAGLMAAQYSAMVKRMHAGRAAQSGVYAAQLAKRGFTGITNILEADYGGFCSSGTTAPYDLKDLTLGIKDKEFWILTQGFKPYACCALNHPPIDAVESIMTENKITPDMIEKITVQGARVVKDHVGWEYKPVGITGAQMNLPYCLAVKVLEGEVFVDQFTEEKVKDPKILDFIKNRIEIIHNPELDKLRGEERRTIIMDLRTKQGEAFTKRWTYAKGTTVNPLTREEVVKKFEQLAGKVFNDKKTEQLRDSILSIEKLDDVRSFSKLLRA